MKKLFAILIAALLLLCACTAEKSPAPEESFPAEETESAAEPETDIAPEQEEPVEPTEPAEEDFRELTAEELAFFEEYTNWLDGDTNSEISCFFLCGYSDPRDIEAFEFVWASPKGEVLTKEDEEEFDLAIAAWDKIAGSKRDADVDSFPVPCRRVEREYIDGLLKKYAGITLEDMNTNWFEKAIYVPETDCFYSFKSDVGGGAFIPRRGEITGDTVTLHASITQYETSVLTFKKSGESWLITSFSG